MCVVQGDLRGGIDLSRSLGSDNYTNTEKYQTDNTSIMGYQFRPIPLNSQPNCYNKNQMPPTEDGKGLLVNISMNLNSLLSIDEPTQVRAKNLEI